MREALGVPRVEPDLLEELADPRGSAAPVEAVDDEWLGEHRLHAEPGVERGVGVLEHQLDATSNGAQLAAPHPRDVLVAESHRAGVGVVQPHDRAPEGALAAAGLADQPERPAGGDVEADARHRLHRADLAVEHARAQRVLLHQSLDLEC